MSWIPFADQLAALNDISSSIAGFVGSFLANLVNLFYSVVLVILYPAVLVINLLYSDVQYAYNTLAVAGNTLLGLPDLISVLFQSWLPTNFPTVWTLLFVMSVSIASFGRLMRLAQYVKSWIPILFG